MHIDFYSPCRWLIHFSCMNSTCNFGGVWSSTSLSFADFVANERHLVLCGGVTIDFNLLFADGEWPCTLEHGNDAACLADKEHTTIGRSVCFTGLGGRRGRVSSDLPQKVSGSQSLSLAADIRPSARSCWR